MMDEAAPSSRTMGVVTLTRYGFFFGLGLSVAAWAAYIAAYAIWPMVSCSDTKAKAASVIDRDAPPKAEFADVEERTSGAHTYFIGVVKNVGEAPARSPQVQVNLFKGGKFVDQYTTYIPGTLAPGESRHFKISCDCRDSKVADHDSYKIHLLGGF